MRNIFTNNAGALVWFLSGTALVAYASLIMSSMTVPGVEQLVDWLGSIDQRYIFIAAFVMMFIEGLYFIGSFFPGSSSVIILAILSGTTGPLVFLLTIAAIFIAWSLAGGVNIYIAHRTQKIRRQEINTELLVKDNLFTTWFPAFRANYEVAQVADGADPWRVFLSSVRVKFLVSLASMVGAYTLTFFIDLQSLDNEEGAGGLLVIAAICFTVGVYKLR